MLEYGSSCSSVTPTDHPVQFVAGPQGIAVDSADNVYVVGA